MKQRILILLLTVAISWAEPVAEVDSIDGTGSLFYRDSGASDWKVATVDMGASVGQHLRTDADTIASLRFLLGGQANLDKGSEIEIISPRDINVVTRTIVLKKGAFWAQFDKQKAPIEIKTSAGVMGIRGTEFLVEIDEAGETVLSLIEGEVEITPEVGESYFAKPGHQVRFGRRKRLRASHMKPEELMRRLKKRSGRRFFRKRQHLLTMAKARKAARTRRLKRRRPR